MTRRLRKQMSKPVLGRVKPSTPTREPHHEVGGRCSRCDVPWPCLSIVALADREPQAAAPSDALVLAPEEQQMVNLALAGLLIDSGHRGVEDGDPDSMGLQVVVSDYEAADLLAWLKEQEGHLSEQEIVGGYAEARDLAEDESRLRFRCCIAKGYLEGVGGGESIADVRTATHGDTGEACAPHVEHDGRCARCAVAWPCLSIVAGAERKKMAACSNHLAVLPPGRRAVAELAVYGVIHDTGTRTAGICGDQTAMAYRATHSHEEIDDFLTFWSKETDGVDPYEALARYAALRGVPLRDALLRWRACNVRYGLGTEPSGAEGSTSELSTAERNN